MTEINKNSYERNNEICKVQTSIIDSNVLKTNKNVLNVDATIKAKGRFVPSRYMDQRDPKKPLKAFSKQSNENSSEKREGMNNRLKIARSSSTGGIFVNKPLKPMVSSITRLSAGSTEMICSTVKSTKASTPVKRLNNSSLSTLDLSYIPRTLSTADESHLPTHSIPNSNDKSKESTNNPLIAEMNWARYLQSEYLLAKSKYEFELEEKNAFSKIMALSKYTEEKRNERHLLQLKKMQIDHDQEINDFLETQKSLLSECKQQFENLAEPLKNLKDTVYSNNCQFKLDGVIVPSDKTEFTEELAAALAESNDCFNSIDSIPDDFMTQIQDLSSNLETMDFSIRSQIDNLNKTTTTIIKSGPDLINKIIENVFNC